jgi:SAM-dependent methyltransferase
MDDIEERSVTHLRQKDILTKEEISDEIEEIRSRLIQKYGKDTAEYNELNEILEDLSNFELGRFLICNKSLSGYWTHYLIMGYKEKNLSNRIEKFMLEESPGPKTTRERFNIFQKLILESIKDNSVCCSVPCGLMTEYITLDIDENISNVKFVGIDLDKTVFEKAHELAKKYNKTKYKLSFIKEDAWSINIKNEFDILTSNGLNIYEKNDDRVTELYKIFLNALKPGGIFIGSATSPTEEWETSKTCLKDYELQHKISNIVLQASFFNLRSSQKSESQLIIAGFENIQFYWDTQKRFYTFKAKKPINN